MKRFLVIFFLLVCISSQAREGIISKYRDVYFTTGIPLDKKINSETADIKFQLSVKILPWEMKNDWRCFIGYTQISVWNFYGKSSPFRDNSYMPGFYFEKKFPKGNHLTLGIEHRSNGRPYYGNPVTDGSFDDYSRGMNYLYASWKKKVGGSSFGTDLKFGVGSGVEGYPQKQKLFSLDLFLYYNGIVTFNYNYENRRFHAGASVTPIINKSIANVTADMSYRITKKTPFCLFSQFHYGFDEALADCVSGAKPPINIRFGIILR